MRGADDLAEEVEAEVVSDDSDAESAAADRERLRAQRLRADQVVVELVLEQGVGGPRHRALEDALIRCAVPVLRCRLAKGLIVSDATRLGRPPSSWDAWLEFTADDRQEFAHNMVANALSSFARTVFEDRRWSPDRGACLKTYFVNACILQFARLQEAWLHDRRTVLPAGLQIDHDAACPAPDPATTVVDQDELSRLLSKIDDAQLREVVVLRGAGWTGEQAAERAGLSVKAAEGRLARLRKRLRDEPEAGDQGD